MCRIPSYFFNHLYRHRRNLSDTNQQLESAYRDLKCIEPPFLSFPVLPPLFLRLLLAGPSRHCVMNRVHQMLLLHRFDHIIPVIPVETTESIKATGSPMSLNINNPPPSFHQSQSLLSLRVDLVLISFTFYPTHKLLGIHGPHHGNRSRNHYDSQLG